MKEKRIVLSVGQFIHRKGFDLLISAAKILPETGVYIVGGKPTDEYIELANGSKNIHFVDFMSKEALSEYYCAADLMAFLTREDIWGLVVNEAMAHGLPVLTTDRCIAGLEMIRNGVNGYIVPAGEYKEAAACIHRFFDSSAKMEAMSKECLITAREYTIETMVSKHMEYFNSL